MTEHVELHQDIGDVGESVTLSYDISGTGEPVVLIHGALIADAFRTLVAEPALTNKHSLILYHRRGYVRSSRPLAPVSVAQQAADCAALLRHLSVERAHVVGHSYGGAVALQLALDNPEHVHSLALLEPALMVGASAQSYRDSLAKAVQRYRDAGAAAVTDEFLQARWPGYRAALDRMLPDAFDQAVVDANTTFELEIPLLGDWLFGEAEARRITQPVLSVLGGESDALNPRFGETHRTLLAWLPQVEGFVLPGATHFLQLEKPAVMAEVLAGFFARHPTSISN